MGQVSTSWQRRSTEAIPYKTLGVCFSFAWIRAICGYYTYGTTPTTYRFTGQREEATIGLYFYNARWYDPALGRFAQPDTLVPDPGNPQALNRYAYVTNNPLRYTDPTGKFTEEEIMAYFGVRTWDEVLKEFMPGGKLAGMWGWLAVLRAAQFGDHIAVFQELLDFPKPHPVGYSEDYVFVEYEGGIGIARNKPGYREHPFDANGWARSYKGTGYIVGGETFVRDQPYRYRVCYDMSKVDWNDIIGDIAGVVTAGLSQTARVSSIAAEFDIGSRLIGTTMGMKHAREVASGTRSGLSLFLDIGTMLPWPAISTSAGLLSLAVDLGAGMRVEPY